MSVVNVFLTEAGCRVVTDTCSYDGKQPVEFNRKIYLQPGASLAFTVRGKRWIGQAYTLLSAAWRDFDDAALLAAKQIPDVFAIGERNDRTPGDGFELTLCGWSGGPRATRLVWRPREAVQRYDFAPGAYLAPSLGRQDIPADVTEEQLAGIARVQQEVTRRHGMNLCVGGDVELTAIDAGGITVRKIGEYPDKALMQRRMAQAAPHDRAEVAA